MTTESQQAALCQDCPSISYPTDKTRCLPCPRRQESGDARSYEEKATDLLSAFADEEIPKELRLKLKEAVARAIAREASQEKPEGWVTLGVGDGSGQLFVYGPYEAIKECQRKLLCTPAPVDVSHAALADKIAQIIYDSVSDAASIGTQPFNPADWHWKDTATEILTALRAHPAGGVSEDAVERFIDAMYTAAGGHRNFDIRRETLRPLVSAALSAAGIGAGVVQMTHKQLCDLAGTWGYSNEEAWDTACQAFEAVGLTLAAAPSHEMDAT